MHIPTHILSGWVLGNAVPMNARERLFCMIAATVPDVDGLGIVFGNELYQRWHHVAAHNLPFCMIVCGVMAALTPRPVIGRAWRFLVYGIAFHLHLLMDYFGSGPGWPIDYLWPLHGLRFVNWQAWELSSWQNTTAAAVLLAVTAVIAILKRRTPLELLMPSLDAKLVHRPIVAGDENAS
ncbi:MAG: metal-dependent hydrolase [Tepidisphaeraceae bacterium]